MGAATTAALYFIRLFDPFNTLLSLVDDAQEATASLARLVGVTQLPVRIPAGRPAEPTRPPPKPAATGPGCSRRRRPARWKGAPPSSWPTALTQAAAAHRAVVLDAGRIVESGPHADLIRADGTYARLWAAWSAARTR